MSEGGGQAGFVFLTLNLPRGLIWLLSVLFSQNAQTQFARLFLFLSFMAFLSLKKYFSKLVEL